MEKTPFEFEDMGTSGPAVSDRLNSAKMVGVLNIRFLFPLVTGGTPALPPHTFVFALAMSLEHRGHSS